MEKRTYSVLFAWYMPVTARYEVELPADATPEQIVQAAHDAAEHDVWSAQEDCCDGMGPTFVDEIVYEENNCDHEMPIPKNWTEAHVNKTPERELLHKIYLSMWQFDDGEETCIPNELAEEVCKVFKG
jgi:hypothetical protein